MTRVTSSDFSLFILSFFLNHFRYSSAGGAVRANIFDHPDSNCAPIILQEECFPDIKLFIYLYKSTTKTMGGEVGLIGIKRQGKMPGVIDNVL